jgi:prepilin-type N-terminal cleavage/methylation domain-containing protein
MVTKLMKNKIKAFTLIELLVVISILGILMGIVGPKVIDLLSSSEKTKVQAIIRGWVTQIHQYNSYYGYFPPFLHNEEEGTPISLGEEENHKNFIISLKGKQISDSGEWISLKNDDEGKKQNYQRKEFHAFSEDEFDSEGKLIGAQNILVLIDQDGDGVIKLDKSVVDDILEALSVDYSQSEINKIDAEKFAIIHEKVAIFLMKDEDLDVQNVYSWNIDKYFD